jgi:hypothetical protein
MGNLLAHNSDRNPEMQGPVRVHFINNVLYDWGKDLNDYHGATAIFYDSSGNNTEGMLVDVIGNKYIAGPPRSPNPFNPLTAIWVYGVGSDARVYQTDNLLDQTRQPIALTEVGGGPNNPFVGTPPVPLTGLTILSSANVQASVLANAGARPLNRDAVDLRIINEVTNRTGDVISSQDAVGGWPTLAVNTQAFVIPANPNVISATGYTNLENTLHAAAAALEP